MKVYLLFAETPYEDENYLGTYSSLKKATDSLPKHQEKASFSDDFAYVLPVEVDGEEDDPIYIWARQGDVRNPWKEQQ